MKTRRHHNNTGYRQIQRGKPAKQMEALAKRLGVPFVHSVQPTQQGGK